MIVSTFMRVISFLYLYKSCTSQLSAAPDLKILQQQLFSLLSALNLSVNIPVKLLGLHRSCPLDSLLEVPHLRMTIQPLEAKVARYMDTGITAFLADAVLTTMAAVDCSMHVHDCMRGLTILQKHAQTGSKISNNDYVIVPMFSSVNPSNLCNVAVH